MLVQLLFLTLSRLYGVLHSRSGKLTESRLYASHRRPYTPTTVQPPALTAEKSMGRLEDASTKEIDAKPFTVVARPGCARVFLPAAAVTSRHTVSGGSSALPVRPRVDTDRRDETGRCLGDSRMEEVKIDREAMGRLAKALVFICGSDDPTTVALKAAAESGSERDIKKARTLFLKLKPGDRRAALTMLAD